MTPGLRETTTPRGTVSCPSSLSKSSPQDQATRTMRLRTTAVMGSSTYRSNLCCDESSRKPSSQCTEKPFRKTSICSWPDKPFTRNSTAFSATWPRPSPPDRSRCRTCCPQTRTPKCQSKTIGASSASSGGRSTSQRRLQGRSPAGARRLTRWSSFGRGARSTSTWRSLRRRVKLRSREAPRLAAMNSTMSVLACSSATWKLHTSGS
mmetsp:Transcript_2904/g.8248  ORF Transcript_2904/g.8248 Transcript_2904/m.8248 type:complete len:207 (+) Transcript_2904:376-996(+)